MQNLSICSSRCKFCVDKNQSFPHVDVELIRTILLLFMSFHCLSLLCGGYHSSNASTIWHSQALVSLNTCQEMVGYKSKTFDLAIGTTKLTNGILKRNLYPYTTIHLIITDQKFWFVLTMINRRRFRVQIIRCHLVPQYRSSKKVLHVNIST